MMYIVATTQVNPESRDAFIRAAKPVSILA
jgi:hypothetical protein